MAGLVAGAFGAPVTGVMFGLRLSLGNYATLLPLMTTVAVSSLLTRAMCRGTVYTESLVRDGFSLEQAHEYGLLHQVTVESAMRQPPVTVAGHAPLSALLDLVAEHRVRLFPVLAEDGSLAGAISFDQLRQVLRLPDSRAVIAWDLMDPHPPVIAAGATLGEAMELLDRHDLEEAVVVAPGKPRRPVGTLSRHRIVAVQCALIARTGESQDLLR